MSKIRHPNKKLLEGVARDIANAIRQPITISGNIINIGRYCSITIRNDGYLEVVGDDILGDVELVRNMLENKYTQAAMIVAIKKVGFGNLSMQKVGAKDIIAGVKW
jgi:hypothetical protein